MMRQEALALAQKKADHWNKPYRVLRCTDKYDNCQHKVEQSDSYDSPRGWVLVDVVFPKRQESITCCESA